MKYSEDSGKAVGYLRQAIPNMVKHNIVPNPLNYTLWYTYFSKEYPQLNKDLEQALERYGTCPPKVGEELFVQHISHADENSVEKLDGFHKAFELTVNNLSNSLDATAQQTTSYSAALKNNLTALDAYELDAALSPVINDLSANATALCDANDTFQGQLSSAQSEIKALRAELDKSKKEANTDSLTGLYNRRVFDAIFKQFENTRNTKDNLSLIMMDIDKFKSFNDTHGHIKGDQILQFVGNLLIEECPDNVTPVRFGGEEFVIFCPDYSAEKAQEIAEKIRLKLESVSFSNKKTGEKIPPVTASFGIACKQGEEEQSEVVERADKALYAAKDGGRNQVKLSIH